MTRRLSTLLLPALLLLALLAPPPLAAGDSFVVVINAANPVPALPAAEVSKLFLHRTLQWPNGTRVAAVDLAEDAPARDAFSQAVHGKSTAAVKAYWQKMIFSGRDIPPPEKTAAEALAFVRAEAGAVGYVAAGTPLGEGVKALRVTR
jgi:hypothetical protein